MRAGGVQLSREERIRRWRLLSIANTLGGVLVIAVGVAFWPTWLAITVSALMVVSVADVWFLGRRLASTGELLSPSSAEGSSYFR